MTPPKLLTITGKELLAFGLPVQVSGRNPRHQVTLRGFEVSRHGIGQDSPPKMVSITYKLIVDTDETDQRLDLLHKNIRKYGTISNTVAEATDLQGTIRRKA